MKKLRLCKVKLGVLKKSAKGTQRLSNYTIYLVGEHFGKKPFKVKQGNVSGKGYRGANKQCHGKFLISH